MAPEAPLGDDQLHAYVDGRLPSRAARALAARLRRETGAAARVASWQRGTLALREAFAPVLEEPVPAALLARRRLLGRTGPRPWPVEAWLLALVMFAAGLGVGWILGH